MQRDARMRTSFNPSEVNILGRVLDEPYRSLGRTDETARELLARIIGFAAREDCECDELLSATIGRGISHVG
jgi:hypothetical protein